jgi:hypothetical protein
MDQTQLALLAMLGALAARFWEQTTVFADPHTSAAAKIGTVYVTCLLLAALSGALNETFTLTAVGFRSLFFSAALMATCSQAFHIFLNSAVPGLGDILNGLFTQTTSETRTNGGTTNSSSGNNKVTQTNSQKPGRTAARRTAADGQRERKT